MEASVVDFRDNEVNLSVKEEDIAIMYIVQHELLSNKKVDFAGIALKHPLTGEYEVRIVTESGNPLDALVESTKTAREYIETLSELVKSKVKG
jgi:DNA-directed RNA polymerase subunit L